MASTSSPNGTGPTTYNRKDKSLGLLCENFLALYESRGPHDKLITLDNAATSLGVERRRIYDIVNVLESVEVVVRRAKNLYAWHGLERVPVALERIKTGRFEPNGDKSPGTPDGRREKSLGLLSQKFIQMFLLQVEEEGERQQHEESGEGEGRQQTVCVSLEDAAKKLLGGDPDSVQLKTKVRRLYDVANVLTSMRLLKRIPGGKFVWLGWTADMPKIEAKLDLIEPSMEPRAQARIEAPLPATVLQMPPPPVLQPMNGNIPNPMQYQNEKLQGIFIQYVNEFRNQYMEKQQQQQQLHRG